MNKSNEKSHTFLKPLIFLIGVIVIVVLINVPVLILLRKDTGFEEQIEFSCFEIINFAIAIWGSLNIVNFFDRKEFEKFREISKREMVIFKQEQENVYREVNEKNDLLGEIFYEQFLQELLKTIKDVVSERFYDIFSDEDNDIGKDKEIIPFEKLLIVERLYAQVFQMYYNSNDGIDIKCIRTVAKKGIDSVRDSKSYIFSRNIENNKVECYLLFREAEFLYYSNFKGKVESASIDQMKKAADLYTQALKILEIEIYDYSTSESEINLANERNRKLCAYSLNTIGSIFNWLNIYASNDYSKKAVFYCTRAVSCAGNEFQREVYYRNCGVANEGIGDLDTSYTCYRKALETTDISTKTMHCLLSVLDKQINKIIHVSPISPDAKRNPLFGSPGHLAVIGKAGVDINDIKDKQILLKKYCEFTKSIFPNHLDGYLYSAIYYRNSIMINLAESDRNKIIRKTTKKENSSRHFLEEAQRNIGIASLMNQNNKYVTVIGKDIDVLKSILENMH